jgi:hypothetical protein
MLDKVVQPDEPEIVPHPLTPLAESDIRSPQKRILDVLGCRQDGKEIERLKNEADDTRA